MPVSTIELRPFTPQAPQGYNRAASGLIMPTGLSLPVSQLPKQDQFAGLKLPSTDDTLRYAKLPAAERPARSSAEIGLSRLNPRVFIANELETKLPQATDTQEIIKYFRTEKPEESLLFNNIVLMRKSKTEFTYDRVKRRRVERVVTAPGIVEQAGLIILDLLKEPAFKGREINVAIAPLSKLLSDYRINSDGALETPEMPDLTAKIINCLDYSFSPTSEVKTRLYELLEQISIPPSLGLEILQRMDRDQNLDHPLAFQLTLDQARQKDSPWIRLQQERRLKLLELLHGSKQQLFDRYDELLTLSRGLVYHDDPQHPERGKIGMEIEFWFNPEWKDRLLYTDQSSYRYEISSYRQRGRGIDNEWPIHDDGIYYEHFNTDSQYRETVGGHEVTRADNRLAYGLDYLRSLVKLRKWFRDYAKILGSLHLHLDQKQHPLIPTLGELYAAFDIDRNPSIGSVYDNKLGTWEIRHLALPRDSHNLHPGRIADLIGLNIGASRKENKHKIKTKININQGAVSLEQLIWGHLITFVKSPNARLAALMSLHDEKALKYCNPLAFYHTYQTSDLGKIVETLRPRMISSEDEAMLKALDVINQGEDLTKYLDLLSYPIDPMYRWLARHVLANSYD